VGLTEFTPDSLTDASLSELLSRIEVSAHPELDAGYPREWSARVRVVPRRGEVASATVTHPKGDPENPLSPEERREKFRRLCAYAGQDDLADEWMSWIDRLSRDHPLERPPG
jgi:2-methylcitrate dehydratase PrpD